MKNRIKDAAGNVICQFVYVYVLSPTIHSKHNLRSAKFNKDTILVLFTLRRKR